MLLLFPILALAQPPHPQSWTEGTPAANAARWIAGPQGETTITLPKPLEKQLGTRTLLVYFSPGCPHCQQAQPELNALATRLSEQEVLVLGIASSTSTPGKVAAYRMEYGVPYEVIIDEDRSIGSAMGIRSTPSALLVHKDKAATRILDGWYPYRPGSATLVEMRLATDPFSALRPGEYVGNTACAACHPQEMDAWQITHHSVAWSTLVKSGDDSNAECTGCHVTGAGQDTGWNGDKHSKLVDVGCEACHGPGGPHDGTKTEARTTCEACHDAKHSIAFSFEKGLPHIDHFEANGMEDQDWSAARRALLDGTAPKELLAFPDGKQLGAEACKDCHEAEYTWWKDSPHAAAMGSLSLEKSLSANPEAPKDVACVQCHATATQSGVPPATLEGYHTDQGVGCESCHGPGEAHVAAEGGTDNIEGLGDDCPVCVLEAVCTRCHTKEWDPLWTLDERLPKVKHGSP
jgi:peroxiredoxin